MSATMSRFHRSLLGELLCLTVGLRPNSLLLSPSPLREAGVAGVVGLLTGDSVSSNRPISGVETAGSAPGGKGRSIGLCQGA